MRTFLFNILLLGFSLNLFAQETVYFSAFETINVHDQHQYVTSKLFKNYVDANGKYTILLPDALKENHKYGQLYSESIEDTKTYALAKKTSYYLIGDMSAIGDLLIVNLRMYNTASGQLVWSDALKADELEDLDPVIRLLANALGTDQPAVDAGNIYSVTQYDSKELNKRQATQSWGVTFGGGAILAPDARKPGMSGFGVLKSYDVRDLILDVKAELYFGESTNAARIGMNILKPLSDNDFSLFYGGGIYYGGMGYEYKHLNQHDNPYWGPYYEEVHSSGLELEGNFGVLLNRLSSIQLRATITPMIALYKIDGNAAGAIRFGITATF